MVWPIPLLYYWDVIDIDDTMSKVKGNNFVGLPYN